MLTSLLFFCAVSDHNTGLLLLCEVALGGERELYAADYYAANLPAGASSTKGVGETAPDPKLTETLSNGCKVPCGPGMPVTLPQKSSLLYNEYVHPHRFCSVVRRVCSSPVTVCSGRFIVYDTAQIKMRYLVRTRFNYK